MKPKQLLILLLVPLLLTSCATNPNKIQASYVSPVMYKDYDKEQIIMEMDHISRRTLEVYNSLKQTANDDAAQMTVGLLIFWPALFFLEGGDGPEAAEYARLKGQYEALRTVAVQKKIDLRLLPPSPEQVVKKAEEAKKAAKKE